MKSILYISFLMMLMTACASKKPPHISPEQVDDGFFRTGKKLAGHASWYGGKFHGRRTANGEIFNKNELTAAHKTLPFGTWLEITNLDNNEKLILRVNDRGPYIKGRILDLSRAAAEKLGFLIKGATQVVAEVLTVKSE